MLFVYNLKKKKNVNTHCKNYVITVYTHRIPNFQLYHQNDNKKQVSAKKRYNNNTRGYNIDR